MANRKQILIGVLVLVVAGLIALSFRPEPVAVSVAVAGTGPLSVTIEQEGRARVRERYDITAPVTAYAPRVNLDVGDSVEQGQALIRLLPQPPQLLDRRTREQARATVAEAEAALDLARKELARIENLHARGDVSDSTLNQAQTNAEQARAILRAARAQLTGGGFPADDPEPLVLTAPVSGQVLAVGHESAGTVGPGSLLLSIGDAQALEMAVDVLSEDAVRIRAGMPVRITRWGGGDTLEGVVRTVEPTAFTKVSALGVEEQRVWVICDITSPRDKWDALGDGYRVEARFILWQADNVLKVPTSALFRSDEGWAVFVVEEGIARRRTVEPGRRGELEAEIRAGLTAGDRVITHPDNALKDGAAVEVRTG